MFSSSCHLLSLNVRGLRNTLKRSQIYKLCEDQKFNIMFMQETYWTKEIETVIQSEWRGKCFFSHGTNHSCGVSILINDKLDLKVNKIDSQNDGRTLLLDVTIEGYNVILVNVYAPTRKSEREKFFFIQLNKWLSLYDTSENKAHFILGGDLNCVLNI